MRNTFFYAAVIVAFIFAGCANTASQSASKTRFQSVSAEQAILLQTGEKKESCAICGMHLATFYKTNHAADTKDGTKQYCSLHCVVEDNEINKTDLKNLRVVDAKSLKFISAMTAFYVVGSSKPGTMSRVSKYAFAQKADAEAFSKEFGGKIMEFYDAYDKATEDFTKKK